MRWEDTKFRKLYVDQPTDPWHLYVSLEARGLFDEILKRLDSLGMLYVGNSPPADAVARAVNGDPERVARYLSELLEEGCMVLVQYEGRRVLLVRNYVEAQEAHQTDRLRKAESRARARDRARKEAPIKETRQLELGSRDRNVSKPSFRSLPDQTREKDQEAPAAPSSPSAWETATDQARGIPPEAAARLARLKAGSNGTVAKPMPLAADPIDDTPESRERDAQRHELLKAQAEALRKVNS